MSWQILTKAYIKKSSNNKVIDILSTLLQEYSCKRTKIALQSIWHKRSCNKDKVTSVPNKKSFEIQVRSFKCVRYPNSSISFIFPTDRRIRSGVHYRLVGPNVDIKLLCLHKKCLLNIKSKISIFDRFIVTFWANFSRWRCNFTFLEDDAYNFI